MTDAHSQAGTRISLLPGQVASACGHVYSYTLLHEAAEEFAGQLPYYLALVRLDDGSLITAQLTDVDGDVAIGDRVEMVTRKLKTDGARGIIVYGYKFRPLIN